MDECLGREEAALFFLVILQLCEGEQHPIEKAIAF